MPEVVLSSHDPHQLAEVARLLEPFQMKATQLVELQVSSRAADNHDRGPLAMDGPVVDA